MSWTVGGGIPKEPRENSNWQMRMVQLGAKYRAVRGILTYSPAIFMFQKIYWIHCFRKDRKCAKRRIREDSMVVVVMFIHSIFLKE